MLTALDTREEAYDLSGSPVVLRHPQQTSVGSGARLMNEFFAGVLARCQSRSALAMFHPAGGVPEVITAFGSCTDNATLQNRTADMVVARVREVSPLRPGDPQIFKLGQTISVVAAVDGGAVSFTIEMSGEEDLSHAFLHGILTRMRSQLDAFFQCWAMLQKTQGLADDLTSAIEQNDIPTLLVDQNATVRFANRAARKLLQNGEGLKVSFDRLAGDSLMETVRVRAAIDHVLASGTGADGNCPVLTISRGRRRPLLLAVAASDVPGRCKDRNRSAIVHVFDPEQDQSEIISPVCELYGLSPRETKLTCWLVNGHTLGQAAKALRLTEQTARSYLKQIFAKTETSRQAELVQLMSKSAVRILTRGRKHALPA